MSLHKRILCIDDDHYNRGVLKFLLSVNGYEVVTADDGSQALPLAKARGFDLYLVDNLLPDISGVELCRELRTFDLQTPIIFHSAVAYQSDIDSALAAGAQEYLAKPVGVTELISAIERVLK